MNEAMSTRVSTKAPRKLARAVLPFFAAEGGVQGLWLYKGDYYEWYGGEKGRWVKREPRWLHGRLYELLEGFSVVSMSDDGKHEKVVDLEPTRGMVESVEHALSGLVDWPYESAPRWVGWKEGAKMEERPDPLHCVAFRDVVVDVKETARRWKETGGQYLWATYERGPEWFGMTVMPFDFDPEATCETWDRCMKEWSGGDEVWVELRERFYGYVIMPTTKYARWLLEHGQPRAGKGAGTMLLREMMGEPGFFGCTMRQLSGSFGLDGLVDSQAMVIGEASHMDKGRGNEVATLLKSILGRDSVNVDVKYQRARREIVDTVPIVQSNQMPKLPNDARGLSAKMVALGFDHSFVGKEDFGLDEKLKAEVKGVARRWMEAAVRLEAETDPQKKFVMPASSMAVIHKFESHANPVDSFLEAVFERSPGRATSGERVRRLRGKWEKETGQFVETKRGTRASDQSLLYAIESQTTWPGVERGRKTLPGDQGRIRVLWGVVPKPSKDDD